MHVLSKRSCYQARQRQRQLGSSPPPPVVAIRTELSINTFQAAHFPGVLPISSHTMHLHPTQQSQRQTPTALQASQRQRRLWPHGQAASILVDAAGALRWRSLRPVSLSKQPSKAESWQSLRQLCRPRSPSQWKLDTCTWLPAAAKLVGQTAHMPPSAHSTLAQSHIKGRRQRSGTATAGSVW